MSDSVTHVYKIDGGTTIKLNDATAAIADIKVGMQVTDLSERDPQTLDSISLAPGSGASSSSETSTPKKKKPTPTPAST